MSNGNWRKIIWLLKKEIVPRREKRNHFILYMNGYLAQNIKYIPNKADLMEKWSWGQELYRNFA